jgi:hypothetical protein
MDEVGALAAPHAPGTGPLLITAVGQLEKRSLKSRGQFKEMLRLSD